MPAERQVFFQEILNLVNDKMTIMGESMEIKLSQQKHEQCHCKHQDISPEQHKKMIQKMGISEKEEAKWHAANPSSPKDKDHEKNKSINPFAVGGGFLAYCVRQGWLIQQGKGRLTKYYPTDEGRTELAKFGIDV